ncbi:MAG: VCBS repeat-containing protein, partial [bacterium]|nr:VCBS repeat-containing protein [bacterium]
VDESTLPAGVTLTTGNEPLDVTLAAGEDYNDADFGYQQQNATIGDFIWNDLNGDGIQDVLLLSGSGNALYLGDGKGRFRDITREAGIVFQRQDGHFGEPRQPLIADFDNDGLQDILITYVNDSHKLYKNLGKAKFKDVSFASGLGGKNLVGGPATTFDYDKDGLLDIYIGYFGNYLEGTLPTLTRKNLNALPNKLFKNLGNMKFKDVTQKSGVGNTGWGQAVAHTDFDLDGWQDLIVGNDFGVNEYYRNRGDGTFETVADK